MKVFFVKQDCAFVSYCFQVLEEVFKSFLDDLRTYVFLRFCLEDTWMSYETLYVWRHDISMSLGTISLRHVLSMSQKVSWCFKSCQDVTCHWWSFTMSKLLISFSILYQKDDVIIDFWLVSFRLEWFTATSFFVGSDDENVHYKVCFA